MNKMTEQERIDSIIKVIAHHDPVEHRKAHSHSMGFSTERQRRFYETAGILAPDETLEGLDKALSKPKNLPPYAEPMTFMGIPVVIT